MTDQCSHPPPISSDHEAMMAAIFCVSDMTSLTLFRNLKIAGSLMSHLLGENRAEGQLSAARMQMLIRLAIHERLTAQPGMLPSELSRHLRVSRNTVSALLNGLEDQKLIERRIDPEDRRRFLIRLTTNGHAVIAENAPPFAAFVDNLFESLSPDERQQLIVLLNRVIASMHHKAIELGLHPPETLSKEPESPNKK